MDIESNSVETEALDDTVSQKSETILSKKQQKRLAKKKKWAETKALRRAKEKEKRRKKIEEASKSGRCLGPSRRVLKANRMVNSSCQLKVLFDLSFDTLMTEAELSKTLKQLHRCYSLNRRASAPLQMYVSGYSSDTEKTLAKLNFMRWDVHINQQRYADIFEKSVITYLTSDSPHTIETLDHSKVYIIGALVDHNRLKNISYNSATKDNVNHAKLPLGDYVEMKAAKVLTIDQVFLILLRVTEGMTWEEAFLNVIPKRKGVVTKQSLPIS